MGGGAYGAEGARRGDEAGQNHSPHFQALCLGRRAMQSETLVDQWLRRDGDKSDVKGNIPTLTIATESENCLCWRGRNMKGKGQQEPKSCYNHYHHIVYKQTDWGHKY
jgi:hypothetical protein